MQNLLNDPTASFWLKSAVQTLNERDALDAFQDARAVFHFATKRLESVRPEMFQDPNAEPEPEPENIIQFPKP
tara:strand:+ start:561 stop:779 length:219 start_codon:yes stop_codon:yes gene_type:complete